MDLKNKVVVITGAANGLGKALAIEFYKQGCHLALIDVDLNGLEKVKEELRSATQKVSIHQANVAHEKSIIATRVEILSSHKHIDMVVNNAGISISQYFEQIDLEEYKRVFDINYWGTIYCTKHFLPDLKSQPDSRLVNITSGFALMGFPGKTAYGSSKSAISGFTNALKTEFSDTSVKVCLVIPPPLNTGLVKNSRHMDDMKKESEVLFLEKNGLPLDETAQRIVNQIRKGKYRIIIGKMTFITDLISRLFPTLLLKWIERNKGRFG